MSTAPIVYDYGRPRELHLDAGLAVSETAPRPDARDRRVDPAENRLLVDGPHFHLLPLTGPEAEGWLPPRSADSIFPPFSQGCPNGGHPWQPHNTIACSRHDSIVPPPGHRPHLAV